MPIAKITGQGLFAIGVSVALLWGCLVGERLTMRQATELRVQVLHDIRQLQQRHASPVSDPAPRRALRSTMTVG